MIIDLQTQSREQCYQWMTQAVVPRPIAWTLSENDDGGFNLAPFSYFNALCSAPPLIGFSISNKEANTPKDTLYNIRARQRFVVHIAAVTQLPDLNQSSAALDYGDSETAKLNLKTESFGDFVRLSDCPIAILCNLHKEIALDDENNQTLVLGEIQLLYAADTIMETDSKNRSLISVQKMNPGARLSAGNYARLGEFISFKRPQ
ncbi:MAG: flavin reductase family protein [Gammaproteobacteria bacterium WSBS_2016_MAG_OTU1]